MGARAQLRAGSEQAQALSLALRAGKWASRPGHRALARSSLLRDWFPCAGAAIFPSGCEGKLGVALESLQGLRDLT